MRNNIGRKGLVLVVIVLFIGAGVVPSTGMMKKSMGRGILYVGGSGPGNYSTIQSAINDANSGDTIFVFNGTYYENVEITKDSIKIIGEDKNTTIIDANDTGDGFSIKIKSHYMEISNFTIRNANGSGIAFQDPISKTDVKYNKISNCIIYNSSVNPNYWSGNGIRLGGHDAQMIGNLIINCEIFDNDANGVRISRSAYGSFNDNQIINCKIYNNGYRAWWGYRSKAGISIGQHSSGLYNTHISGCEVFYNAGDGIYQNDSAYYTNIDNCTIYDNIGIGINFTKSSNDCVVSHNNLINNSQNAYDGGSNKWDDDYPSGGNFWDDYTGEDSDGDGIGDTPYDIPGGSNQDNYPLMHLFGPPYAEFIYDNETSEFNASISGDYNGVIVSFEWDFGDGTTGEGEIIYHKYCDIGTYDVTLTVTDNDGLKGNITKSVEVIKANIPPSLEVYGPNYGKPGEEYEYVFIITDPDGDENYLYIDWGDGTYEDWMGPFGSGQPVKISHAWNETGTYVIKAKVKDFCGESEWATFEVIIPRNRMSINSLFLRLLERFLDTFQMMRHLFRFIAIYQLMV